MQTRVGHRIYINSIRLCSSRSTVPVQRSSVVNAPLAPSSSSFSTIAPTSFSQFNLLPETVFSVLNGGVAVPTSAQQFAIPRLVNGENVLLISQTGRGKTLAYLIPMVDKLLRTQKRFPMPNRPRGVIIVPTRELVSQVLGVVRNFFGSSITSMGLAPGMLSYVKEKRVLCGSGVDIAVVTPARLEVHLSHHKSLLAGCEMFVVDEADTLCDSVFESQVLGLLNRLSKGAQIAIVGATRTAAVNAFIAPLWKVAESSALFSTIVTNDAHMTVPQIDQVFVPVGRRKRTACLAEILGEENRLQAGGSTSKTLIFTNTVRTCNFLSRYISECKESLFPSVSATSFHGSIPPRVRASNFKKFISDPNINVLVCTNLASRGIDLNRVDHVVMYDFPHTLADYLHRAGRTGRGGQKGKVTALFTKKDEVLAKQIEYAARAGKPVCYKAVGTAGSRRSVSPSTPYGEKMSKLSQLRTEKKHVSIRALRAQVGLAQNPRVAGVRQKAAHREWKQKVDRPRREENFLRNRLGKFEQLPTDVKRFSETKSGFEVVKEDSAPTVQLFPVGRPHVAPVRKGTVRRRPQ